MILEEALIKILSEFGVNIILEPRALNMLNDYHGFDNMQSARHILRAMQENGLIRLLLSDRNNITKEEQLINQLHNNYGFDLSLIRSLINSVKYSLNPILSTEVSDEDYDKGWIDENGVIYSKDKFRLLSVGEAQEVLDSYKVLPGTKVICDYAFFESNLQSVILPE